MNSFAMILHQTATLNVNTVHASSVSPNVRDYQTKSSILYEESLAPLVSHFLPVPSTSFSYL